MKKNKWSIICFFVIAITSGVFMAEYEAHSTAGWQTYTSKDAGISFKYPKSYKIVEDKGWRITIYISDRKPENNIKITYSPNDPVSEQNSLESQISSNCQPTKVSAINGINGSFKVYEDNMCGGQIVGDSILVYPENNVTYDITSYGTANRTKLYTLLSTFQFQNSTPPAPSATPLPAPSVTEGKRCGGIAAFPCPTGFMCKLDGSYPDAGGKCVKGP